jgi:hypothetical protein
MRVLFSILIFFLLATLACDTEERYYYQIKFYRLADESQEKRMDSYLKDAYIPAMNRAGVEHVGVFKPIEEDTVTGNIIVVFVPFNSLEQLEALQAFLDKDPIYQEEGRDFIEAAHDQPPYERLETTLLKSFWLMPTYHVPDHSTPAGEQIYELRSYESATEKLHRLKVEMFNEGGEIALFAKLDFKAVFYGSVISGAHMPNLMYMTSFENPESNSEHWDAFRNDPDWLEMKELERYANTVSHIDRWLLHPTDYSGI